MTLNDVVLLSLYAVSEFCVIYMIIKFYPYFRERFAAGAVNQFMLAMLGFMTAYGIKMATAFCIRISYIIQPGGDTPINHALQTYTWTAAQCLTTASLIILAILTRKKRFDVWFYLRRQERENKQKEGNE